MKADFFKYVAQTSPEPIDLEVERAEGIYLIRPDGSRVIDFISGICVNNLGHGVKPVQDAIIEQVNRYLHPMVYGEVVMTPQVRYARRLARCLDTPKLEAVYFVTSGAEAVEGALKVAKKYTGRRQLVACRKAYHGSTHGAMSVSDHGDEFAGYGPGLPNVNFIEFNNFGHLQKITTETAAIIIEPIQGAGGIILPKEGYLQAVRDRCNETGTLMILDEIQTGFGRTGHLFAHQGMGFTPDMLLLAKALGAGMPLGAFVTSQEIMAVIQRNPILGHVTTFGGHPVCCAAGLAGLEYLLEKNLMAEIPAKEAAIRTHLQHPDIVELRGTGLLFAMILPSFEVAEKVRKAALDRGLLTIGFLSIDNGLRISPPLTITEEEIEAACGILRASLGDFRERKSD